MRPGMDSRKWTMRGMHTCEVAMRPIGQNACRMIPGWIEQGRGCRDRGATY
jgi:hypothetical protein